MARGDTPRKTVTRSSFVDGLAWLSIVLSALMVVSMGLQVLALNVWLPADAFDPVRLRGLGLEGLPPSAEWVLMHLRGLIVLSLLLSVLALWASIDLLRRRNWARWFFIAMLGLGATWSLGSLFYMGDFMPSAESMLGGDVPSAMRAELAAFQRNLWWASVLMTVLFVALHGWIIWKLVKPPVSDEFRSS